jgi:cell wall-associated NlpC family hydrolase
LPVGQGTAVLNLPPVAAKALGQLGAPYRLGGADPAGFDCSGLVQWAFAAAGVAVPRTTEEQFHWFQAVPREDLQPGDLVFFRLPQAHVGIYLGAGEFVHAPASGRTVERARLDSPWFILGFAGGGRAPLL